MRLPGFEVLSFERLVGVGLLGVLVWMACVLGVLILRCPGVDCVCLCSQVLMLGF